MVPADRQPAGHEAVRQQKGAGEGTHSPKNGRPLGHPSVQLLQVGTPERVRDGGSSADRSVYSFLRQILLGFVHVAFASSELDHPTRSDIIFQRRPEHQMDRIQLPE